MFYHFDGMMDSYCYELKWKRHVLLISSNHLSPFYLVLINFDISDSVTLNVINILYRLLLYPILSDVVFHTICCCILYCLLLLCHLSEFNILKLLHILFITGSIISHLHCLFFNADIINNFLLVQ